MANSFIKTDCSSKISQIWEFRNNLQKNLTCIFLSVWANSKKPVCHDGSSISTVSRLLIHVGCPTGFKLIPGSIPGWGQIGTDSIEDTIFDCSDKCNSVQNCCSFEYSQTDGECNLNIDCQPTNQLFGSGHSFCTRGKLFSLLADYRVRHGKLVFSISSDE